MKNQIIFGLASFAFIGVVACGGDDNVSPGVDSGPKDNQVADQNNPNPDGGADTSTNNPSPPALGTQIDRMGRPAANTAANNTFNVDAGGAGMAKDAYNAANDPTKWQASFLAEIGKNLGIYDGLDTVCGNQALAGMTAVAGRYNGLAGALADDRLYLNTAGTACTTYLGVELNATGLSKNMDCGGRGLAYDVIDTTYNVVAGTPSGLTDGINADPAKTGGKTFPYLAAAQ